MKKLLAILIAFPLLLCACSDDEDTLPKQRDNIASFLKNVHKPSLVPESQAEPGSVNFYSTFGNTVFRYIPGIDNPDRENRTEVTRRSTVAITFRMYVLNTSSAIPDTRLPDFSNDPDYRRRYVEAGLDVSHWNFTPFVIDMAHDDILKGLYLALLGCRQGDAVEAYMTYNMAYGDAYFSIIPKESPVYIHFTVDDVE